MPCSTNPHTFLQKFVCSSRNILWQDLKQFFHSLWKLVFNWPYSWFFMIHKFKFQIWFYERLCTNGHLTLNSNLLLIHFFHISSNQNTWISLERFHVGLFFLYKITNSTCFKAPKLPNLLKIYFDTSFRWILQVFMYHFWAAFTYLMETTYQQKQMWINTQLH